MANLDIIYKISADISGLQSGVDRAAKATEGLQSTASKLGTAIAGAFTLTAIQAFAGTVLEAASSFQKMADQTGLTTDEVQKLNYLAGQTDVSVSSLVSAVQNLQQRLGDDNSGASGALKKLGIHADAFNRLNTYEQMTSLAEAVRGIKDPTEQASAAAALFGKNWKEILPAIKAGMKEVGDQAPIMAKQTIDSLNRIDDAMKAAKQQGIAWSGSLVLAIHDAGFAFGDFLSRFNPEHFNIPTSQLLKLYNQLNDPDGLKRALGQATDAAANFVDEGLTPIGKVAEPTAADLIDLNRATEKAVEKTRAAAEAAKKAQEALEKWDRSIEDATIHMNLSVFTLHRFGAIELPNVESSLKGVDTEIHNLASTELPQFGISIYDVGKKGVKSFGDLRTAGQKMADSLKGILQSVPQTLANAFTGGGGLLGAAKSIGSQLGSVLGDGIGKTIKTLGSLGGPIGSAIGSLAGSLIGAIGKLFSSPEKQINPIRQAFIDAAGGLDALNRKAHEAGVTLQRLLDAKTPEAYKKAIDELTAALNFQSDAMKFLDDTVQKYGFSIEELGPKFSQQKLTQQAFALEKEFRALAAAGIDVGTISEHMKDAINDYLHAALKTGAAVPESMRDILKQLAAMGLLTDANGDAITDLEAAGIHFSKTLDQQFEDLIATINKLVDAITRGLGGAIDTIPKDIRIKGQVDWSSDFPNRAEPVLEQPLQFATGGIVPGSGAADSVPALLTPGEMVLTRSQVGALSDRQPVRYDVTINAVDARSFEELLAREGGKTLINLLDHNAGGVQTSMREVLGVA